MNAFHKLKNDLTEQGMEENMPRMMSEQLREFIAGDLYESFKELLGKKDTISLLLEYDKKDGKTGLINRAEERIIFKDEKGFTINLPYYENMVKDNKYYPQGFGKNYYEISEHGPQYNYVNLSPLEFLLVKGLYEKDFLISAKKMEKEVDSNLAEASIKWIEENAKHLSDENLEDLKTTLKDKKLLAAIKIVSDATPAKNVEHQQEDNPESDKPLLKHVLETRYLGRKDIFKEAVQNPLFVQLIKANPDLENINNMLANINLIKKVSNCSQDVQNDLCSNWNGLFLQVNKQYPVLEKINDYPECFNACLKGKESFDIFSKTNREFFAISAKYIDTEVKRTIFSSLIDKIKNLGKIFG